MSKEGMSFDKFISGASLAIGERANQFDHFLEEVPNIKHFLKLEELSGKKINAVIFDIDGTLVPPYGEISQEVINLLLSYKNTGKKVAVYTNSPNSPRLDVFRRNGIEVIETTIKKPSSSGFQDSCNQLNVSPENTAMIGNFAITDMPLTKRGDRKLFPLNILVQSIPPSKNTMEDTSKFIRARIFHTLNLMAGGIVKLRNPDIVEHLGPIYNTISGVSKGIKSIF